MSPASKRSPGFVVAVSAPSGGGKTTVIRRIMAGGNTRLAYSVSATTRPRRPGEVEGADYYFISERQFEEWVQVGNFIEHEFVHGYHYGTPRDALEKQLAEGKVILCDIDVKGALSIKRAFGEHALTIFLDPPSMEELVLRLRARNTESADQLSRRLMRAPEEVELSESFDARVVNDDLESTVSQVLALISTKADELMNVR